MERLLEIGLPESEVLITVEKTGGISSMFIIYSNGIYRSVILALAGLMLTGASSTSQLPVLPNEAKSSAKTDDSLFNTATPHTKTSKQIQTSKVGQLCDHTRYRNDDNLCAQWEAADAARDAADWAWWQLGLSTLGVIGLVITLWFNIRGLARAGEANQIAREIGQAQARAYLSVESAKIVLIETRQYIECAVKNSGLSPAVDAVIQVIPSARYLMLDIPTPRLQVIDFGISDFHIGSLSPGEIRENVLLPFLPKTGVFDRLSSLNANLRNPATNSAVTSEFFLKWFDVFGVECDNSGIMLSKTFTTQQRNFGVVTEGVCDVRTTGYDTATWFKRWLDRQKETRNN